MQMPHGLSACLYLLESDISSIAKQVAHRQV